MRLLSSAHPIALFKESLDAAKQALEMASNETWIKGNFAHALLFLNRFEEAQAVYLEKADQKVFSGKLR